MLVNAICTSVRNMKSPQFHSPIFHLLDVFSKATVIQKYLTSPCNMLNSRSCLQTRRTKRDGDKYVG